MGSGTSVDVLDSSATNSYIDSIYLRNTNTNPSNLNQIKTGSTYGRFVQYPGAIFGGIGYDAPDNPCATPVTNLKAGQGEAPVTHNTMPLTWTNPTNGYIALTIYYRLAQAPNWIQATTSDGIWVGQTGYTFQFLSPDTAYDFKVTVTCKNGGTAITTLLGAMTTSSPS